MSKINEQSSDEVVVPKPEDTVVDAETLKNFQDEDIEVENNCKQNMQLQQLKLVKLKLSYIF